MTDWEADYIAIRKKEGFFYSDAEVNVLPLRSNNDLNYSKWQMREKSTNRLLEYLTSRFSSHKRLLDLGCGNGWFSNRLARIDTTSKVEAWDINQTELEQAIRVFQLDNLTFKHQDIFSLSIKETFDFVILNSVVQYFPDLGALICRLIDLLEPNGEIHILDSPFYHISDVEAARKRSEAYYNKIGFPQMAKHYYHHEFQQLDAYQPELMYQPHTLFNKVKRKLGRIDSPFTWIKICRQNQIAI